MWRIYIMCGESTFFCKKVIYFKCNHGCVCLVEWTIECNAQGYCVDLRTPQTQQNLNYFLKRHSKLFETFRLVSFEFINYAPKIFIRVN